MIRLVLRLLSTVALAIAVIMAVLDATRTIAASALVMTPLGVSWRAMSPDTLDRVQAFVTATLHPLLWEPVLVSVLALPGFAVFAGLSLVLFVLGRKPSRRLGDLALER